MKLSARKVNNYDLYASHAWYVPGVKGMFAIFGLFLLGSFLGSLVEMICMGILPEEVVQKYSMVVVYPLSFIPAMLYVAYKSQRNSLFEKGYKLNSSNFGSLGLWGAIGLSVVLAFATMIVADLPNYWNYTLTMRSAFMQRLFETVKQAMELITSGPLWSSFLVTAIFAPIFEEWMCRGVVLRGLLVKMKPAWAIVLSALFFALIHMNPWQALNAFIIGLVMGYVYYRTGSLLLTMLLHFVNNATAVIIAQFSSLDEMDMWIDVIPHGTYAIVYVAGLVVFALILFAFSKIPLNAPHGNIDVIETEPETEA